MHYWVGSMTVVLDGKSLAEKLMKKLPRPKNKSLGIILVGDNKKSRIYINCKRDACEKAGITFFGCYFPGDVEEWRVKKIIEDWNNSDMTGILIQLPLPERFNTREMLDLVSPDKDVDGLNSNSKFKTCTPNGMLMLLDNYNVKIKGKVVIVGYGKLVGKPLAKMLDERNILYDVITSNTKNATQIIESADVIFTATGVNNLIKKVKKGAVVVDAGTGDIDYELIKGDCSYVTPIIGGVGPMTVYTLISNIINGGCVLDNTT